MPRNSRAHKSSRGRGNNKLMLVVKRNRGYSADLTIRRGAFTRKKGDDTCVCVCMCVSWCVPDDTSATIRIIDRVIGPEEIHFGKDDCFDPWNWKTR